MVRLLRDDLLVRGVLQVHPTEFYGSHAGTFVIFSVQSVVTFGGRTILGFVVDRYGTRPLLVMATALVGVGLLAVS